MLRLHKGGSASTIFWMIIDYYYKNNVVIYNVESTSTQQSKKKRGVINYCLNEHMMWEIVSSFQQQDYQKLLNFARNY